MYTCFLVVPWTSQCLNVFQCTTGREYIVYHMFSILSLYDDISLTLYIAIWKLIMWTNSLIIIISLITLLSCMIERSPDLTFTWNLARSLSRDLKDLILNRLVDKQHPCNSSKFFVSCRHT